SHTRSEIQLIRRVQRVLDRQSRIDESIGTEQKVRKPAASFIRRGKILVAQTNVQRERRRNLPVILNECGVSRIAEVPLSGGGGPGVRIGVDGFEDRRVVRQVKESGEGIIRPRA